MDTLRPALVALVALAAGCLPPTRTLALHPLPHANHDRRFYLVVRALKEEAEFVSDPYPRITELVFPTAPDPSVKLVRLVVPGHDDQVELTLAADAPVAVYALFTDPGDSWKVLLTPPLRSRYDFVLDGNRLSVRAHGNSRASARASTPTRPDPPGVTAPSLPEPGK